jgi:hypothetical protein
MNSATWSKRNVDHAQGGDSKGKMIMLERGEIPWNDDNVVIIEGVA